jgi:ABC-type multidrug transport system fused ATPase/permease subunit
MYLSLYFSYTSRIDSASNTGVRPRKIGRICFHKVTFSYPARPTVAALQDVSFNVEPNSVVAFVGPRSAHMKATSFIYDFSGSGKSTILQLIMRFYVQKTGFISIDNNNIEDINVHWLRDQVKGLLVLSLTAADWFCFPRAISLFRHNR